MKALIVERDVAALYSLEWLLRWLGHEVVTCTDARAAWRAYQQEPYPLVILDWLLPNMESLRLCRQIRSLPNGDYSMILITNGCDQPEGLQVILEAGADDYLPKSVNVWLLKSQLLEMVEQKQCNHSKDKSIKQAGSVSPKPADSDERESLLAALKQAKGNRKIAARLLGISRATFYRRLAKLGIALN